MMRFKFGAILPQEVTLVFILITSHEWYEFCMRYNMYVSLNSNVSVVFYKLDWAKLSYAKLDWARLS